MCPADSNFFLEVHPTDVLKPTEYEKILLALIHPPDDEFLPNNNSTHLPSSKKDSLASNREKWLSRKRKQEKESPSGRD